MARSPKPPPIEQPTTESDRVWPLDMSIAALAGLVLYLIVTQLHFDDPRLLYNAWTYALAVPVIAMALAFMSHGLVSRRVQKSMQLGFLFSVFVHLLLLLMAINVIILSQYFPETFASIQRKRTPVQRTLPEYLFQSEQQTQTQPDWSQPVEAETTSPVRPEEVRQLPPVERTAPKLEAPRPRDPEEQPTRKFLMKRERPSESQPQPSDSPAQKARQRLSSADSANMDASAPKAPEVPTPSESTAPSLERDISAQRRSAQSSAAPQLRSQDPPNPMNDSVPIRKSLQGARNRVHDLPMIGQSGPIRNSQRSRPRRMQPAGTAPSAPTVAVAREDESSDRVISPEANTSVSRQNRAMGAAIEMSVVASLGDPSASPQTSAEPSESRNNQLASQGVPNINAGSSSRPRGRSRSRSGGTGFEPAGAPVVGQIPAASVAGTEGVGDEARERTMEGLASRTPGTRSSTSSAPEGLGESSGPLTLEMLMPDGPPGLADVPRRSPGVIPSEQPRIAALDFSIGNRRRREVGGPATPFGTDFKSVESFSRRVMRTKGGASPSPAGTVGESTEEAIEAGLSYLASIQNEDGSWSLQGHGSDVVLRSDTAATGLCLLAFQGAGYTHVQDDYDHAETVRRGIDFLVTNQKTNGDLFRSEDDLSNRNVAFYSQGIASLALCEAYGMTQDQKLKAPTQRCLDYIAATQNRQRGGWRYSSQVSADTSVTGWMMMALKSGQLAGLKVENSTYEGINRWLGLAQADPRRQDRYRYNPFAPNTPTQRHGKIPTPTMTSVGMLMRMYQGWRRDRPAMRSAAEYILKYPPQMGTKRLPQRDAYYWYYATQFMFHMGGDYWERWNASLTPMLLDSQVQDGPAAGSWDPQLPVADRWSPHAGRLYVTTMNLLNLEVYYRHLPIYEDTAD